MLNKNINSADAYVPRDVVNAPQVKAAIIERCAKRALPSELTDWLSNHFFRYLIGCFDSESTALNKITSLQQAKQFLGTVPSWLLARLDKNAGECVKSEASLWFMDPQHFEVLALESKLIEFLGARLGTALEGKLMRINCHQALVMWEAEHRLILSQQALGWCKHQPSAVRQCWQSQLGYVVELLGDKEALRSEMAYESQAMQHCLGQFSDRHALTGGYGQSYAQAVEQKQLRLFSYRTGESNPHVTISVLVNEKEEMRIDQIKGKQNKTPIRRYTDEVILFLNTLNLNSDQSEDTYRMGIVMLNGYWRYAHLVESESDQLQMVRQYPNMLELIQHPVPSVQWLMLAKGCAEMPGATSTIKQTLASIVRA